MSDGKIIANTIDFGVPAAEQALPPEARQVLEQIRTEGEKAREVLGGRAADIATQKHDLLKAIPQRYWNYAK